jgi:hypothetical protein
MTMKIREWTRGKRVGFEVDIRFTYPDGAPFRRRIKAPVESRSAAKRWGEAKERELLMRPSPVLLEQQEEERKEVVPTLREFGPRYVDGYARANKQRPAASTRRSGSSSCTSTPSSGTSVWTASPKKTSRG